MGSELSLFVQGIIDSWVNTGAYYAASALVFVVASRGHECNKNMNYWNKANVITDIGYWFVIPIFSKYVKILLLMLAVQYVFGLHSEAEQSAYFKHGYGLFSTMPIFAQVLCILIFSDFLLYWLHRMYHGHRLWKIHAVHHSSKELDWASAARFHPINVWTTFLLVDVLMLLLGFAPEAFILLAPFNAFYSAFVHANLNWKMGWLGYVLASPVFHRWHHTSPEEGGNKNFAPTFPVLDMIFGTYYMPKDKLPEAYGIDDQHFPLHHFVDQLFYPFRK